MINDSQSWVGRTNFRAWIPPGHPLKSNPGMRDIGTRYNLGICFIDGGIVFPGKVKAVQHYRGIPPPPSGNPLVFSKDEAFQLLAKGVWWEGRKNDVEGFFPPKCVEELSVSSQLQLPKIRIVLRVLNRTFSWFKIRIVLRVLNRIFSWFKIRIVLRVLWGSITGLKNDGCSQVFKYSHGSKLGLFSGFYGDQLQVSKMMVVLRFSNILMVQN